jgi:hypothetical protein
MTDYFSQIAYKTMSPYKEVDTRLIGCVGEQGSMWANFKVDLIDTPSV